MVQKLKLGSLYVGGKPVTPGTEYKPGQAISFRAMVPDKAINWVPVNGLLIADRCLLTSISWDDLNAQNLVFGKEIKIQGFQFCLRLLKVGSTEGALNEWDTALDIVGDNDDLWNWRNIFFWGQESVLAGASLRVFRGYGSARYFDWFSSGTRYSYLGFRPALEPLHTDHSALRPNQDVLVIWHDGCVVGKLVEETQYDLVLQPKPDGLVGNATFAANLQDSTVAVDRSGIVSITST